MNDKERAELIRKGNEFFNNGNVEEAIKIFVRTKYRDGITRIADYYFYDKKLPLIAVKFYRLAKRTDKINEIFERMMYALGNGSAPTSKGGPGRKEAQPSALKVSPKLKILAEEILRNNEAPQNPENTKKN